MANEQPIKIIATNRKARHLYHILDTVEAGLVLSGTEVKSLRAGRASLVDAYAAFSGNEAYVYNLFINAYEQGNRFNVPERRPRKLLLHRREINRLIGQVSQKGFTLVALQLYFKGSRVKLQLGLAKGKREYDKREDVKERESKREMDRALKDMRHGPRGRRGDTG
ncbi:MAG: SsrA-binding protein SmpB [Candidatus Sumerlaeaceae bacterium]|nr:SsrA-binding protein SmpB [Candidatus Sumerlaeaceae bacterium]